MALFRRELTLRTMARPEQVSEALNREVKPGSLLAFDFPGGGDGREFRGEVKAETFRIVRRVQFRNSFAPVLEGRVFAIDGGSELKVTVFVPTALLLFVIFWSLLATAAAMMTVQQAMLEGSLETMMMLAVGGIPFVGLGVAWLGYSLEASRSERALKGLVPPYIGPTAPAAAGGVAEKRSQEPPVHPS